MKHTESSDALDATYKKALIEAYDNFKATKNLNDLIAMKATVKIVSDYFFETAHKLEYAAQDFLEDIQDKINSLS